MICQSRNISLLKTIPLSNQATAASACHVLFQVLAQQVTDENLQEGRLYPPLVTIQDVSLKIAVRVSNFRFLWLFVFPPALCSLILSPNAPSHKLVYVNRYWTRSSFKIKFKFINVKVIQIQGELRNYSKCVCL